MKDITFEEVKVKPDFGDESLLKMLELPERDYD